MTPSNFTPLSVGNLPRAQGTFIPTLVAKDLSDEKKGSADPSQSHRTASEPVIELKKDGDRITEILIRCSCGEVIRLDCA